MPSEQAGPEYTAARERAAYIILPQAGYLRIRGEDRVDWLQRQTSNDLRLLSATRAVRTVLTSPTARILDVLLLLDEGDTLGIIPLPGRAVATLRYLRGRIFFMDKVQVTEASAEVGQILLEGPNAATALQALGLPTPAEVDARAVGTVNGARVDVVGQPGVAGTAYRLLAPAPALDPLRAALDAAHIPQLPGTTHDILRVEAGLPAAGHELTEEYTPLEVGLRDLISETKGCYTGQEVIARQITYDKVARHLVGLRLDAPVAPGTEVRAEGKPVGKVTSAVVSPRFGPIALAVLRRPYHEPGTEVTLGRGDDIARGVVTTLPFA